MKIFLKPTLFTIFFLLNTFSIIGQENFIQAYLINSNKDTIKGYIDYKNWSVNPQKIKFSNTLHGKTIKYTPKDIVFFEVKDEKYFSAIVQVETSPFLTDRLEYNSKFNIRQDTAFIRALIIGTKSLFHYRTKEGKDQFYIQEGNDYTLLKYKKYLLKKEDKTNTELKEKNIFIAQLKFYLKDFNEVDKYLINTKYNEKSLTKLFTNYYNHTENELNFYKETEKLIFIPAILTGMTITNLKFTDDVSSVFNGMDLTGSNNITAAVSLNVVLPRNNGKWSFYNELAFTNYRFEATYTDFVNVNIYENYKKEYGHTYLKLFNMFRYNHKKGNGYFYVNLGISNGYSIIENNYYQKSTFIYGETNITEGKILNDTRKYELGFIGGGGFGYKNFFIDFKYEIGNGTSAYVYLSSRSYRYYFNIGYKFQK